MHSKTQGTEEILFFLKYQDLSFCSQRNKYIWFAFRCLTGFATQFSTGHRNS